MHRSQLLVRIGGALVLVAVVAATPALSPQELPAVEGATIWTGAVVRGDLVQQVRGPGTLQRFGRGWHAHVRVAAQVAQDVALDQPATIDTRADVLEGRVVHIDDEIVEGTLALVVEITSETPDNLRKGLSIDARVQTGVLEDVVYVPRPAFGQAGQKTGIFRLSEDGTQAERVSVSFGPSSVDKIVVVDGLAVGDHVILSDMSRYAAAERIRITGTVARQQ